MTTFVVASAQATEGETPLLKSAIRRAAWRIIPFVGLGYLINFMDRTSVGYAALQMNQQLGLTATEFGWGAGLFFVTYCLLEVPSNLAMRRFGARRWIARIMITWGIAAAANGFVTGPLSFYAVRFVLGAFEAGFFPGIIWYISIWFPGRYRTTMLALFAVAAPVSQFVGAPISAGLLQMSGVAGLAGWQWMFLIEGIPAILVGIAALWVLSDTPADASWMPEEERDVLMKALAGDVHDRPHSNMRDTFRDPRAWIMAGITFCFTIGSYGVSLWLPLILKGHDLSTLTIGWLSMLPYAAATIATLAWARYVDRTGKRTFSLICALTLGLLGLLASTRFPSLIPALLSLTAALAGMIAARTIFLHDPANLPDRRGGGRWPGVDKLRRRIRRFRRGPPWLAG